MAGLIACLKRFITQWRYHGFGSPCCNRQHHCTTLFHDVTGLPLSLDLFGSYHASVVWQPIILQHPSSASCQPPKYLQRNANNNSEKPPTYASNCFSGSAHVSAPYSRMGSTEILYTLLLTCSDTCLSSNTRFLSLLQATSALPFLRLISPSDVPSHATHVAVLPHLLHHLPFDPMLRQGILATYINRHQLILPRMTLKPSITHHLITLMQHAYQSLITITQDHLIVCIQEAMDTVLLPVPQQLTQWHQGTARFESYGHSTSGQQFAEQLPHNMIHVGVQQERAHDATLHHPELTAKPFDCLPFPQTSPTWQTDPA